MPGYEYASVTYGLVKVETIVEESPKYQTLTQALRDDWQRLGWTSYDWWEAALYIRTPGSSEAEKRIMWDPTMTGWAEFSMIDVLNELGAQGWELAAETVFSSVVTAYHGHERASRPIEARIWLKRGIDA